MKATSRYLAVILSSIVILFAGCKKNGCTDPGANNYNPDAGTDDGSCEIMGCTDPSSVYYNPEANVDDGSCAYPDRTKTPIAMKVTGENCYHCGDWGWEYMKNYMKEYKGKIMLWSNYGGSFSSGAMEYNHLFVSGGHTTVDFLESVDVTGFPTFVANKVYPNKSFGYVLDSTLALTADVGAVFKLDQTQEEAMITAQVAVFENTGKEYWLGAYVIEDKVVGPQGGPAGDNGDPEHALVMRGSMSSSTWGVQLCKSAGAEQVYTKKFKVTLPSVYNKANLYYGIIVWSKEGDIYKYENAYTDWK